ncbi:MAG: DUF5658 family protein [Armatimonadota bacterium]
MALKLTRESIVLIAICVVDLASTLFLLRVHGAREGNPLMAFYLRYGVGTFVLMKLTLIFLPVFVAEWSRQYRPRFVRFMLRAAIVTYAGVYLMLFLTINVGAQTSAVGVPIAEPIRQGSTIGMP